MIGLKRFVRDEEIIKDLCDYFTKLIFHSCHTSQDDEIPLEKMKEIILNVFKFIILKYRIFYRVKKTQIFWLFFVELIFKLFF